MKQKIDYKVIVLLVSISILLITISGGEFIDNTMISLIYDVILYILLFVCIIFVENILSNNKRGTYLSIKENIALVIASASYLLIKNILPVIVGLLFINNDVSIIVLIILRYILLSSYINYLLLINQDDHNIKQILINELIVTLAIIVVLLLFSITIGIVSVLLRDIINIILVSVFSILVYIVKVLNP